MAKIRVNILNEGKIFGIKTPVYNFPMDADLVMFLRDIGFRIEKYVEPPKPAVVQTVEKKKEDNKPKQHVEIKEVMEDGVLVMTPVLVIDEPVVEKVEEVVEVKDTPIVAKKEAESDFADINPLLHMESAPEKCTKDTYTTEELLEFTRTELLIILNYRGHYSSKTGKRDAVAPRFHDSKKVLIDKIMQCNK